MTELVDERDRRWALVRAGMAERGIDCLIVVGDTGLNLYRLADLQYLTNLPREGVLLFPLEGEPVMFSFGGSHDGEAWVTDHRNGYPLFATRVTEAIAERGWQSATFGAVLSGYDGDLTFPEKMARTIATDHPQARIVDATAILVSARRIKSDYEIACFREGCAAGQAAIAAVAALARPGVSDLDVKAELMATLFRNGCSTHTLLLFHSGHFSVHGAMGGAIPSPTGRVLADGDVINAEFDAKKHGYNAQFNQPFYIGAVDPLWHDIARVGAESFHAGVDAIRPGLTAGELQDIMRAPVNAGGFQSLGPMFHGLGHSFEPPVAQTGLDTSLPEDLEIALEPGMVLELEPHVVAMDFRRGASFGCPVLVTETGCELLPDGWQCGPVLIPA